MIHGVINIYKEKGYTSHDVVAKLRGIVKQKKIGHTGTLDPDAEGVLPVCFGKATKLCDMLTETKKAYRAVLLLGKTTDTQDISGNVLCEKTVEVSNEEITKTVRQFIGDQMQIPPMYSALKVNGKKLYELARQGIEIERKARPISISEIEIEKIELPRITILVNCSKGTYIRTLCHDIGERLQSGGCMEQLTRVQVGRFAIDKSITLRGIQDLVQAGQLHKVLVPIDTMFDSLDAVVVQQSYQKLIRNGNVFMKKHIRSDKRNEGGLPVTKKVRVYDEEHIFYGVYEQDSAGNSYKPVKMFLGE